MFPARTAQSGRFSLLLLDENEFYVRDYLAACEWPADVVGSWQGKTSLPGQLRLCTKSVFFEPEDVRVPIVRIPFSHVEQMEGHGRQGFSAVAKQWSKMKANAADSPYIFEKGRPVVWKFTLSYAPLAEFMPLAQRMLIASRLNGADRAAVVDEVLQEMERELRFDPGHLRSPSESIVAEVAALRLAPLVREPCRLALTPARLYMQPLHNISGGSAVLSHPLDAVAAVARRRSGLKDIGLEIFFVEPPGNAAKGPLWGSSSAFFAFKTPADRDRAAHAISSQPSLGKSLPAGPEAAAACARILEADGEWLSRVTSAWQRGRLSTFDYLLFCNLAAGRSFNDLTQYPVFPWVLQDYSSTTLDLTDPASFRDLSRPVGALNPARLARYVDRFKEMTSYPHPDGEPPFLYGTHYSCPGYVMFWLVRAAPAHMLRLQTGRFDAADRLFCSVAEAWDSVLSNHTDVKELIPEFYMPARADFLVNRRRLALGQRQDGRLVGDVELPPWAGGSPEKFLEAHRAALEAPCVSANLHHWLDLIFGAKQRGAAAAEAHNVFRELTYEGAIDLESIADPVHRAAAEASINEFGQCPRQIFRSPHPRRLVCPPPPAAAQAPMPSSGQGPATANSLSLSMLTAVMETLQTNQGPFEAQAEAAVLLEQLDVVAAIQRREAAERKTAEAHEAPSAMAASGKAAAAGGQKETPFDMISGDSGPGGPPMSRSASAKSALMGRLTSLKDALGEAAARRRDNAAATAARSDGDSNAGMSSAPSASRLSSLATSLTTRWYSATSNASDSATAAPAAAVVETSEAEVPLSASHPPSSPAAAAQSSPSPDTDAFAALPVVWKTAGRGTPTTQSIATAGAWGAGLRGRVTAGPMLSAGVEAINSVALCAAAGSDAAPFAYTAGHDAAIRVFDLAAGGCQVRAKKVGQGQPLASLALLPRSAAGAAVGDKPSSLNSLPHPDVVAGSYDGCVYAFCPSTGAVAGSFTAHGDAVACVEIAAASGVVATASWDCSVKLWSLEEGRHPWGTTLPLPVFEIAPGALPGGVWALALSPDGRSALTGTEEGQVAFLDLRQPAAGAVVWREEITQDYVGGLSLLDAQQHAVAACADGSLVLLDCRKSGQIVSSVGCGTPLRCCASDGAVAVAGGESGAIEFWDVNSQLRRAPAAGPGGTPPGPDGRYDALLMQPASAVNALAVEVVGGGGDEAWVVTGHEDGSLRTYCAG